MTITVDQIGSVSHGGLGGNLTVRLEVGCEQVRVGDHVVIRGTQHQYYGLVVDVRHPPVGAEIIDDDWTGLRVQILAAEADRGLLESTAEIMLTMEQSPDGPPATATTIPPQRTAVVTAGPAEMASLFGQPSLERPVIGYTPGRGLPVPLSLDQYVSRSSGVFGATGSGKSMVTRMLIGHLARSGTAAVLVLDAHNEHAADVQIGGATLPGLRSLLPGQIRHYALAPARSVRGQTPDHALEIAYQDIETDDLLLLRRELGLRDTTSMVLDKLDRNFGADWLKRFAAMPPTNAPGSPISQWADRSAQIASAAAALRRRIQPLLRPYLVDDPSRASVSRLVADLEAGRTVILSYGPYTRPVDQVMVANVLARRLMAVWRERTSQSYDGGAPPHPLVIVVEEAHRLLSWERADLTVYGEIARESRKDNITLLLVDQRVSAIDDEVISQLGTRITGWLGDDDDAKAATAGLRDRDTLRGMLRALRQTQEVLVAGWAVPMPVVVRSRRYAEFVQAVQRGEP